MVQNKSLIFNSVPHGFPVAGKDLVVKETELDLTKCPEGGIITKNLFVSYDPYQRGRMRDASIKSYSPPYDIGSVVNNDGIARVVKSDSSDYREGEIVGGPIGTELFSAIDAGTLARFRHINNEHNLPLSNFTGILGMSGLTAYSSFYAIGKPQKGETIFVSAASGAVGAAVGQLAKREGLTVIGSVGSDDKAEFITKELGFDGAFNYKTENPHDALKRLAPNGIDIYYDNVGGIQLEAAIGAANLHARFIECGMISYYNLSRREDMYTPGNLMEIVAKRLTIQGFIVHDPNMGPIYAAEHQSNVAKWLASKEMTVRESTTVGIDNAANGLIGMLKGENFGKAVLKLDHADE
ncbi:hypothetical protein EDC01DRAFT_751908 [Geopyxis carbonaria]|nr:hypothetical protein EDC01DRAFT_751908 [Geopyxis carbonaria]